MSLEQSRIIFGPVHSRRLGQSLGINNIPAKACSYACVYCQAGKTDPWQIERATFFEPEFIQKEVVQKINDVRKAGGHIDYLTFVPDGEPTLDGNLGRAIDLLKPTGIPLAVLTNGSLLWREDVRRELMAADWVSVKVDAANERAWRRVNRPHPSLRWVQVVEGIRTFAREYRGTLATETLLVKGANDDPTHLDAVAGFLAELNPVKAYVAIPTRAPAEAWVHPADSGAVRQAMALFSARGLREEPLTDDVEDAFVSKERFKDDLLAILAVHPMTEEALRRLAGRAGADWDEVRDLLTQSQLIQKDYRGKRFYALAR